MLAPSVVTQEGSAFYALLKVIADPVAAKKQLDEMVAIAQSASDAQRKLVEERIALQKEKQDVEALLVSAQEAVTDAVEVVKRANDQVNAALEAKVKAEILARGILVDARATVSAIQSELAQNIDDAGDRVRELEDQELNLEKSIEDKNKVLDDVNQQLEALRGRL